MPTAGGLSPCRLTAFLISAGLALLLIADPLAADEAPGQSFGTSSIAEYPSPAMIEFFERQAKAMHLWQVMPPDDRPFCVQFQRDLAAMENITFVRPIVQAETLDDPALQKYTKSCPRMKLNKLQTDARYAGLPEKIQEEKGVLFFARRDFSLYYVNIDDNPNGTKKYIFFANSYCLRLNPKDCTSPFYKVVDFKQCLSQELNATPDPYDEGPRIGATYTKRGETAIIEYYGRHYVLSSGYDGYGYNGDINTLDLGNARRLDGKTNHPRGCTFSANPAEVVK